VPLDLEGPILSQDALKLKAALFNNASGANVAGRDADFDPMDVGILKRPVDDGLERFCGVAIILKCHVDEISRL